MARKGSKKVLTEYLSEILQEQHNVPVIKNGEEVFITKGEALARQMVNSALGYTETIEITDRQGNIKEKEVIHPPSKAVTKEILERVEGKVSTSENAKEDDRPTVADKISERGKKWLNRQAKKSSLKI